MDNCKKISELLPEYIGKRTTREQNSEVACHVAVCLSCRADFVLWLSAEHSLEQQLLQQEKTEAAAVDYGSLFAKLPERETELERIINSGSYTMIFDLIQYVFSLVQTTYRLAGLA